jgi:hypothetical protein
MMPARGERLGDDGVGAVDRPLEPGGVERGTLGDLCADDAPGFEIVACAREGTLEDPGRRLRDQRGETDTGAIVCGEAVARNRHLVPG